MKRDMDLVREILIAIEKDTDTDGLYEIEGYSKEEITYHARIMAEHGLIDLNVIESSTGPARKEYILGRLGELSWEGQEFLAAARNDTVWNKAKDRAEKQGLDMPFEIFKNLMMSILKSMVLPGQ